VDGRKTTAEGLYFAATPRRYKNMPSAAVIRRRKDEGSGTRVRPAVTGSKFGGNCVLLSYVVVESNRAPSRI
jgi:hypothetical protein